MKFGVLVFPGSNCDDDMVHVLGTVMGQQVRKIWHKDSDLGSFTPGQDCIVVPGGFSYGDYLRAGAIARFSPVMQSVVRFAEDGGLVCGICNGFQILCEAGLLPGALLRNTNQRYISKNVHLSVVTTQSPITRNADQDKAYKIPIAHADGRYYCDSSTLDLLKSQDRILFRYCDEAGRISETSNPNGSIHNIAGVMNEGRNVFGMMPHPERAAEALVGNEDGRIFLNSLLTR